MANTTVDENAKVEECVHIYRGEVLRVIDGDTIEAHIDLGFGVYTTQRLRLFGVNTPEKNTEAGKAAILFVTELLYEENPVIFRTMKRSAVSDAAKQEKYGRYLVEIFIEGKSLSQLIIEGGHGKAYFGEKRD